MFCCCSGTNARHVQVEDELGELHDLDTAMLGMGFGLAMGLKVIEAYRKVCKKQAKEEAHRKALHDAELEDMRKTGIRVATVYGAKKKGKGTFVEEKRRMTKSERDTDIILGTVVSVAKNKTVFLTPTYYPVQKEETLLHNEYDHIYSSIFNGDSNFITQSKLTDSLDRRTQSNTYDNTHSHIRKSLSPEGRGRRKTKRKGKQQKHKQRSSSKGRKSASPEAKPPLSSDKNSPSKNILIGFSQLTSLGPSQSKLSQKSTNPSSRHRTPDESRLDAFSRVETSQSKLSLGRHHSPTRVNSSKIETKRPML